MTITKSVFSLLALLAVVVHGRSEAENPNRQEGQVRFTAELEATPASPPSSPPGANSSEPSYILLPYRSESRALSYLQTFIRRHLLSQGFRCRPQTCEPLPESIPFEQSYVRPMEKGENRVELQLTEFPSGGFELYFLGDANLVKALREGSDKLTKDLNSEPLVGPEDKLLVYPLSYVQADRAVAILKGLGYPVIEFGYKDPGTLKLGRDLVFEEIPIANRNVLSRPLVINLLDSQTDTLVGTPLAQGGTGGPDNSTLKGGQPLNTVTDAVAQQRLLLIYDDNDRLSLDRLLLRLNEEIDVPAKQILMEALVVEIDHDRLLDLGIDFNGKKDNSTFSFEEKDGVVQPFTFIWRTPAIRSVFDFVGALRALEKNGEARVLSRPSVLVLDGRQARIKIADEIPYTKEISTNPSGLSTSTDFLTAGIILNLKPRAAFDNSEVSLQVETIISSASPVSTNPADGILVAPRVQSREVQTLVRVANDTPFVIGGLISKVDQKSKNGIPFLNRIPGLRKLFLKKNVVASSKEVIIVITPHIIDEEDETYSYTIPRDSKLFDSFNTDLFRNVYRVRSTDVFDLSFILQDQSYLGRIQQAQTLAKSLSKADFKTLPPVSREDLEEELSQDLERKTAETFLTFFDGGVPGEEIFVHRMLIGIIEKLGFDDEVPIENIIFFPVEEDPCSKTDFNLDPDYLTAHPKWQHCFRKEINGTLIIDLSPCSNRAPNSFSPPIARVNCKPFDDSNYRQKLSDLPNTILLNTSFPGRNKEVQDGKRRRLNPIEMLRSVLVLQRLLDLNPKETFPRTLKGLHPGRELVFPTLKDLSERKYVLDRETVKLFRQTLDYYDAFKSVFSDKVEAMDSDSGLLGLIIKSEKQKRDQENGQSPVEFRTIDYIAEPSTDPRIQRHLALTEPNNPEGKDQVACSSDLADGIARCRLQEEAGPTHDYYLWLVEGEWKVIGRHPVAN